MYESEISLLYFWNIWFVLLLLYWRRLRMSCIHLRKWVDPFLHQFTLVVILFPCKSKFFIAMAALNKWNESFLYSCSWFMGRIKEMVRWNYSGDSKVTPSVSIFISTFKIKTGLGLLDPQHISAIFIFYSKFCVRSGSSSFFIIDGNFLIIFFLG